MGEYVDMNLGTCESQQRALGSLELQLQLVISHTIKVWEPHLDPV